MSITKPRGAAAELARTCFSLVIPVYRNEETLDALLPALQQIAADLDHRMEVVFVVDGSPDRSYQVLQERLPQIGFPAQLIGLSRNFGSFAAIRMGLEAGRGPYFAVLAADLQEPPELIVSFLRTLETEPFDITIGTRETRGDPWLQSLSANLFWALYRRFVQPDVPAGGVDVFGCNLRVRDALLRLRESNSTLVGLLFWLGFRRKTIPYARRPRVAGRSAWTWRRKLRYLMDSCFALTDLPVTLIMTIGALGSIGSILLSIVVFVVWAVGGIKIPGYTPVILVLLISFTSTMLALGIMGGYVWRTFENTKDRPLYVPMTHEMYGQDRTP
ncbi:glycosyltransferase family 2 protein [Reyranella sp.]|jgi:glycosyltransferase involved in cell wall biosynthesis|uniref:glycosyltransferase family 2 protein n=1 Tax=Reyranella sp. TaxID=1929291 RepID=UPI002F942526